MIREATPYVFSAAEQQEWHRVRKEESTKEDWIDFSKTLMAYRRRRMKRHMKNIPLPAAPTEAE